MNMKRVDQYALTKQVISYNVNRAINNPVDLAYLSTVSLSLADILADLSDVEFQKFMFAMEMNKHVAKERIGDIYGVIDEVAFTAEVLALVNRALDAPEEEKEAYLDEVVGRCYAHDMCRAIDDCPTTLITCAAARAFMSMFRSKKFKEHHKVILSLLVASLEACIEDVEDAKQPAGY